MMEGFCRGCLIKFDDPTELLQYTEKNRRLFVYSTGIQVKHNDAFTFLLCKECNLNMKTSCKFKKQCRTSDKRFKNYLALKDMGDNMELCTFLKNNDDTLTFRLPILSGNSTPANQKCRDDDNESTCTSIRNFMSDILQGEEVPDTEARIIREVIEEEADVLDDSLDSHWLQDDISIDEDLRLDLSFSPFSTPHSVNNDHCYTPKKATDTIDQCKPMKYFCSEAILENTDNTKYEGVEMNNKLSTLLPIENVADTEYENGITLENNDSLDKVNLKDDCELIEYEDLIDSSMLQEKNALNYYIENIPMDSTELNIKDNLSIEKNKCSIDKNLEEALKNGTNQSFSLDELLLSPPVFPNVSAPSTPTITNILFGDKINIENENSTVGQHIEEYDNVDGDVDILEEFFKNETIEFTKDKGNHEQVDFMDNDEEDKDIPENTKHIEYDLDKLFCLACKKQFKTAKAFKKHLTHKHKIKLKKRNNYSTKVCSECGKTFGGRANLHRHMKTHKKTQKPVEIFKCEHCPIECSSLASLSMHMKSHTGVYVGKDTGRKYVCTICNAVSTTAGNFKIHQRRHLKSYSHFCKECHKGFYRAADLKKHLESHNGNNPFKCKYCVIECNSLSNLKMHMKTHGEADAAVKQPVGRYVCPTCGARITTLSNFVRHQRIHTKSYTHRCDECGKGFYSLTDANYHMRSHIGLRPFECPQCDRKFTLRNTLNNHLKCHTGERRFNCDYCKKSFIRKATLTKHIKMSKSCFKARMPHDTKFDGEVLSSHETDIENNSQNIDEIGLDPDNEYLDQDEVADDQHLPETAEGLLQY